MGLFNEMFRTLPLGVIIISQNDLRIIDMNEYAKEILKIYDYKQITGAELIEMISADTNKDDFFSISTSGGVENYFKNSLGEFFYGELTFSDLHDSNNYLITIRNAEKERIIIEQVKALENSVYSLSGVGELVFQSQAMKDIHKTCMALHKEPSVNVLIEGETGTGKELIARLIHYGMGVGGGQPFVALNCAAIPEDLFESEMFGFQKGAFTGADNDREGKIELAGSGSLFLDEVGELPFDLQPKLLRVLQEREYYRIGGNFPYHTKARFIAATNRDLLEASSAKTFRTDLYYRLNTAYIQIPPLRERPDDVAALIYFFASKYSTKRNKRIIKFTNEAIDVLTTYQWPGNVRELEHVIDQLVVMTDKPFIDGEDISFATESKDSFILGDICNEVPILPEALNLDRLNKTIVKAVMKKFNGHKGKVCEYLGISRSALRSRL